MSQIDHRPWTPPRPPGPASPWTPPLPTAQPSTGAQELPAPRLATPPSAPPRRPGRRAPRRGRIAGLWSRTSLPRRILLSYVALAAVIAAVVGVGVVVQPSYGTLSPWSGVRVDDVRASPTPRAWAVDLASTLAPGAPAECLRFTAVDVGQDLAAVRADSAWNSGFSDDASCSIVPSGYKSRVALLDTATGAVRWVHDTANDVDARSGVAISWVSTTGSGTRLLVRSGTDTSSVVETLSTTTGQVLGSTGTQSWSGDDRFTANGDVVAMGRRTGDGLEYIYELRDSRALSRVVWQGTANETATLIALDDRMLLGDRGTLQIPLATGTPRPWSGPVNTALGYALRGDVVFAARTRGSGVTTSAAGGFSAVDKTGRVLWSSDLDLRGSFSVGRDCLVVTNLRGDRLTCLDYRTGAVRWSRDTESYSYAGSAVGQRTDDVYTVSTNDDPQVVALDGGTGRVRFHADVPAGSYVVAAGHTVGYALTYGATGARTAVVAFDLSSGRRLWAHTSQLQLGVWGGHVIDVGLDGLARRLG